MILISPPCSQLDTGKNIGEKLLFFFVETYTSCLLSHSSLPRKTNTWCKLLNVLRNYLRLRQLTKRFALDWSHRVNFYFDDISLQSYSLFSITWLWSEIWAWSYQLILTHDKIVCINSNITFLLTLINFSCNCSLF